MSKQKTNKHNNPRRGVISIGIPGAFIWSIKFEIDMYKNTPKELIEGILNLLKSLKINIINK